MKLYYWNVVRQPLSVYHQNSNQMIAYGSECFRQPLSVRH